jgi:thioredoxin reductase (NADPH)
MTISQVENYPGFPEGITGMELCDRVRRQVEKIGVEIAIGEVTGIEPAGDGRWLVHTPTGDYVAIAVIVATGVFPRSLQVPGEKELRGAGVSYCATCDGFLYRGQVVAVVGGGNAAVDEALYLADICQQVYLIHRRDRLRADPFIGQQAVDRPNIEIVWDSVVKEIVGDHEVAQLRLENTQTGEERLLDVSGVFIAVGTIAHTDWLGGLLELNDGFIVTQPDMQTNQPGVFAAGDIRNTLLRQVTTAIGDATLAAYSAYQYIARHRGDHYGEYR